MVGSQMMNKLGITIKTKYYNTLTQNNLISYCRKTLNESDINSMDLEMTRKLIKNDNKI